MGVLPKIITKRHIYFFPSSNIIKDGLIQPPKHLVCFSQSTMENFVLHPVAESTKPKKEQTELTKVQIRTDLITNVAQRNNEYVQFNSNGLRSGALVPGRALFHIL